jgi:hypothetical protein
VAGWWLVVLVFEVMVTCGMMWVTQMTWRWKVVVVDANGDVVAVVILFVVVGLKV